MKVVFLLCSLLDPFTSYVVGSEVIGILVSLTLDSEPKKNLMQPSKISMMVDILNEGSIETKINCTQLIELLIEEKYFQYDKRHSNGICPGLSFLRTVCFYKEVKILLVSIGVVSQLVELLAGMDHDCLELALCVLDSLSLIPEGRVTLRDCVNTIPIMVRFLMRISETCTQYALSILWSVCKLAPEECSSIAIDTGLSVKLHLVIQSGCDPILKQQNLEPAKPNL